MPIPHADLAVFNPERDSLIARKNVNRAGIMIGNCEFQGIISGILAPGGNLKLYKPLCYTLIILDHNIS